MTDPKDKPEDTGALQQELRDRGWRPEDMFDPLTGISFTRWFPPGKPNPAREEDPRTEGDRS